MKAPHDRSFNAVEKRYCVTYYYGIINIMNEEGTQA